MKTGIVMAVHGAPPNDFPHEELREFFTLHGRLEALAVSHSPALESRYEELESKLKSWPRTPQNDPYHAASFELAQKLSEETGVEVVVGFNEFCAPGIEAVLDGAVDKGAGKVVVITTMLTRGGEHAERDISQAVARGRQKYPGVEIVYAWPYEPGDIARFLSGHLKKYLK